MDSMLRSMLFVTTCALTTALGCSSSDSGSTSDSGTSGSVLAGCYALCDQQAKATGCSPGGIDDKTCRQLCDAIVPSFSADCQPKAAAYYVCGSKQTWVCATGGNLPQPSDDSCKAQTDAYAAACFKTDAGKD